MATFELIWLSVANVNERPMHERQGTDTRELRFLQAHKTLCEPQVKPSARCDKLNSKVSDGTVWVCHLKLCS